MPKTDRITLKLNDRGKMINWSFLADPSYKPPEGLLDLNLKVDFQGLIKQLDKKALVRFAVNEAKLVLPIFEAEYPSDSRPRRALEAAEHCLLNSDAATSASDAVAEAANSAVRAAWAARAAYAAYAAADAADAAWAAAWAAASDRAADAVYYAESVANWVRRADPNISIEDQIKRLLRISSVQNSLTFPNNHRFKA